MRLVHFSDKRLKLIPRSVVQKPHDDELFAPKPRGLWVSDEDDYGWAAWCQDGRFRRYRLRFAHDVTLHTDANVLVISDAAALRAFHERYVLPPPAVLRTIIKQRGLNRRIFSYVVDWPSVARQYQGIIISPYQWGERLIGDMSWYYTWYCASGVIWDTAAISSMRARVFGPFPRTGKPGKSWAQRMQERRELTEKLTPLAIPVH